MKLRVPIGSSLMVGGCLGILCSLALFVPALFVGEAGIALMTEAICFCLCFGMAALLGSPRTQN